MNSDVQREASTSEDRHASNEARQRSYSEIFNVSNKTLADQNAQTVASIWADIAQLRAHSASGKEARAWLKLSLYLDPAQREIAGRAATE